MPLLGRLYLSRCCASFLPALPFQASCFFVGFTFLGVVLLCRLYLSGCHATVGFTFLGVVPLLRRLYHSGCRAFLLALPFFFM